MTDRPSRPRPPRRRRPPPPDGAWPGRARPTAALELDHVSRWYGNVVAVNDISFGLGAGGDRPARPERRRQVDAPAPDGRPPRTVGRPRPRPGRDRLAATRDVPPRRARPRARDRPRVPDRSRVRAPQRATAGRRRPGCGRCPGDRHGRPDRGGRSPDRDVFEGHAPARQDRRRARPRPVDPAPRRAVQRHGSRGSGCT